MRSSLAVPVLVVISAIPSTALAQRTTGAIVGAVNDETGAALPGVTVTIKGENIVGTQTSVSTDQGLYRFPVLPPGDYDLTFTLRGFTTVTRPGIRASLGSTNEVNVVLKLSQMAEEVTIQGDAPVVDTQSSHVSTTYDKEWVRNAPVRRFSFFDLINAAPGVTQSTTTGLNAASSTVFGSATDENSYQLDGTDFTAPLTGEAWPYPNTDAIEEVEVLSLGAPAEYGNLQGAVFNIVTRQGSNAFHGDANFYLQHQDLTGRNTEDDVDGGFPYNRDKFNDLTLQLSGPVVKDKLWFFASYQYQRSNESQPGVDPRFPTREEADRIFGKLNWQIDENNKLMFAYHDDYYRLPFPQTELTSPSSIQVEHGHNPSPGVTYTSVLSDKTYVEARYSGFYGKDHADPLNGGPRVNPRFFDLDTGAISGGIYYWYDGDVSKTAFSGKVSHFADKFLGTSHDFKFGVQYNRGGSDYATGPNDYIYTYSYYGNRYGYGYTQRPYHYGGEMRSFGVYVDDTVRVTPRLTLNLGVRFDNSRAKIPSFPLLDDLGNETGETSAPIDELYTWNSVSPRVGFNLKLTADGKTALKGHYGRYHRGIVTGEFSRVGTSITPIFLGDYNFETGSLENLEEARPPNLQVDPNYKNPVTDQFIVQLERELAENLALSLNYVHKRGKHYGAWRDIGGEYVPVDYVDDQGADASGQTITLQSLLSDPAERVFQLTNPPEMFTRVHAFTAQITKRMSNHWQAVLSLVASKGEGRLPSSLNDLDSAQRGAARNDFGQDPNDFINTDGRLIEDRPVVVKGQVVGELPAGFLVGVNFLHQRGRPWGRQVRVADFTNLTTTILAERLDGSRRVADQNILDVRLQKQFKLGGEVSFALFADGLNVLNDDANEGVLSRLGTAESFAVPSNFVAPRRLMVGAKFQF